METLSALGRTGLVPVVVLDDARDADPLAAALVAGGLPVVEVTFRTAAAGDAIRAMADRGDVLLGAGTILTPAQVDEAVAAGASYVVSPGLSRAVVDRCREHGVLALPGAVTATEIQAALELDVNSVKFFPAGTSGGVPAIAALAGPFGGVRFIPTGGIGPANVYEYLAIDAVVAVGGSWMVPRERIRAGDFATVQRLTADASALLRSSAPTSPEPASPLDPPAIAPLQAPTSGAPGWPPSVGWPQVSRGRRPAEVDHSAPDTAAVDGCHRPCRREDRPAGSRSRGCGGRPVPRRPGRADGHSSGYIGPVAMRVR